MSQNISKQQWLGIALVALALGTGVGYVAKNSEPNQPSSHVAAQPLQQAVLFNPARAIPDFELQDSQEQTVNLARLAGQWQLMFLGYTSCPDVCPTTLAKLAALLPELRKTADVKVWLVSVDPKRDSVSALGQYINYFNQGAALPLQAARAEHKNLFPFVRSLGLMYAINEADEHGFYLVDHSASIALINPRGELHAMFKPRFKVGEPATISSEALLADFGTIVASY